MRPIINAHFQILNAIGIEQVVAWHSSGMNRDVVALVAGEWAKENKMTAYLDPTKVGKKTITGDVLFGWLKKDPTRLAAWKACDQDYAEALIDKGTKVLEDTDALPGSVAKAKALAEQYRFIASRTDRQKWGENPAVSVTLNAGDLHLQALREVQEPKQIAAPIPEAQIEVVK